MQHYQYSPTAHLAAVCHASIDQPLLPSAAATEFADVAHARTEFADVAHARTDGRTDRCIDPAPHTMKAVPIMTETVLFLHHNTICLPLTESIYT